jgi:putative transposase
MSIITYKFRVKDSGVKRQLERMAIATNQVWNFCVSTQREAQRRRLGGAAARWPAYFDFDAMTRGVARDLGVHSDTVARACKQFAYSRDHHGRCPRFRASVGPKRALGWVPFRVRHGTKVEGDAFHYLGRKYRFWKSREIEGVCKGGAFVQDARGRWYVTFQCEVVDDLPARAGAIGIDLGLKDLATCSDGTKVPALQHYRRYADALARAQRSRNKKRVRAIHAKIANSRRHHHHVESSRIARENKIVVVGDVSASRLKKTRMAKSISDAGWYAFKEMLRYKTARRRGVFLEVSERFTTVACSECGALSGPQGQKGLRIREWKCSECRASHDRDVNAARNILRLGLECQPPVEEIAA